MGRLITVEDGRIASVTHAPSLPPGAVRVEIAALSFIHLQINGAAEVQFNDHPSATAYILPTFITTPAQGYIRAIAAARSAIEIGTPDILGLHL